MRNKIVYSTGENVCLMTGSHGFENVVITSDATKVSILINIIFVSNILTKGTLFKFIIHFEPVSVCI